MKKQIWLRPDQVELVVSCLKFMQKELNDGHVSSAAHKQPDLFAGRFMYARINDVLELFEGPQEVAEQPVPAEWRKGA